MAKVGRGKVRVWGAVVVMVGDGGCWCARRRIGVVVSPLRVAQWNWFERIGMAGVGLFGVGACGFRQVFAW